MTLLLRTGLFALAIVLGATPAKAQTLAITEISVVDVEAESVQHDQTVIIADGRILAVGPSREISVPEGATAVLGQDRFLIPGLWDMHVHSSSDAITRKILFPLYIANGVTGVRDMNGDCFTACGPLQPTAAITRRRRDDVAEGRLIGPRVLAAGPIVHGAEPGQASSVEAPRTNAHGRALARRIADRGLDFIKVYDEVPGDAFYGLAEGGRELGIPVVGHIPWEVGPREAAKAGMRSFEHLYGIIDACSGTEETQRAELLEAWEAGDDESVERSLFRSLENFSVEKCAVLYAELAERDIWQVPTLVAGGQDATGIEWRQDPAMRYLPRQELEYWLTTLASDAVHFPGGLAAWPLLQYRIELIAKDMYRAGVPLLVGSDAMSPGVFPGFGLHDEMQRLVRAGFSPGQVLRAATVEPARFLQRADSIGTVGVGKVADLVLLDADPLTDIKNTERIHAVIVGGRLLDRGALDALLESAAGEAAR